MLYACVAGCIINVRKRKWSYYNVGNHVRQMENAKQDKEKRWSVDLLELPS